MCFSVVLTFFSPALWQNLPRYVDMNGIDNILANNGIGIAATGMVIVFSALILLTCYIAILPILLRHLAKVLPEAKPHYYRSEDQKVQEEDLMIAAAIAATLRQRKKPGGKAP